MKYKKDKSSLATDWYETTADKQSFVGVNEPINQKQ